MATRRNNQQSAGQSGNTRQAMGSTKKAPTKAIGETGLEHQNGYIEDEWAKVLRGQKGMKIWREMMDADATVGAIMYLAMSMFRLVEWFVDPAEDVEGAEGADASSEAALAEAKFLEQAMDDMSHSWSDFMAEVASMIPFGFAPFEIVWKFRRGFNPKNKANHSPHGYDDGRVAWRKFGIRGQESVDRWEISDDGGIDGFYQVKQDGEEVFIPMDRLILFRTSTYKNNPEGRSLLRPAHKAWFYSKRIQEYEAMGIENDTSGVPVLEVPPEYLDPDADEETKAQLDSWYKMMTQMRAGKRSAVVLPAEVAPGPMGEGAQATGFRLRLLMGGGRRNVDMGSVIRRYDRDKAMVIAAQFLFLGRENVGALSLGESQRDVFATALEAIASQVADTLNRFAVAPMFEMNGVPRELWPKLRHGDLDPQSLESFVTLLSNLVGSAVITPDAELEKAVRERMDLPMAVENEGADFGVPGGETARPPSGRPVAGPSAPEPPAEG